jgi:hypothetical protein
LSAIDASVVTITCWLISMPLCTLLGLYDSIVLRERSKRRIRGLNFQPRAVDLIDEQMKGSATGDHL